MQLQGTIRVDGKPHDVRGEKFEIELAEVTAEALAGGPFSGTQVNESFSMSDGVLVTSSTTTTPDGRTTTTTTTTNTNDHSSTTTTTTTDSNGSSTTTIKIDKK